MLSHPHPTPDSTDPVPSSRPAPASADRIIPIAELAAREDFPQCAVGLRVDINGFVGTVGDIVRNSLKVRSAEGITQSFNSFVLRKLHAPAAPLPELEPGASVMALPEPAAPPSVPDNAATAAEPEAPKRDVVLEPDFTAPVRPIVEFAGRADFPHCALGRHVDVNGFTGVVVEIVKQSLKVRSAEGQTRSYNGPGLRKLYGRS